MSKEVEKRIESYNWTDWTSFPIPSDCGWIEGSNKNNLRQIFRKILCKPDSIGVYQLRDVKLNKNVLFGITTLQTLEKRMASLLPTKSGGISGRNNETKKNYIKNNIKNIEFRVLYVSAINTINIEKDIKSLENHLYNT